MPVDKYRNPDILSPMTDFSLILGELRASGLTQFEIAKATQAGVSTISDIEHKPGREPRYSLGARLIALHAQRCKNTRGKRMRAGRNKTV